MFEIGYIFHVNKSMCNKDLSFGWGWREEHWFLQEVHHGHVCTTLEEFMASSFPPISVV